MSDPGGRIVRRNKQLMIIKMHFPTATAARVVDAAGETNLETTGNSASNN